ncbi:hypothetical protein DFH06DRAFT_1164835 [Mycena polygramma]|nr:hypothetical protein DFH06DRAFT_1164835 [Mycena polygramma]
MSQNTRSNENIRLLSSSPAPPMNYDESSPTPGGVMTTVWNVAQLVHGLGETVRGTVLGAIDDWERKGEETHHQVARQGKAEIDKAYRKLRGNSASGSQPAHVSPRTPSPFVPIFCVDSRTSPVAAHTSGFDAAPPTYQATGNVPRMDSKNSNGT